MSKRKFFPGKKSISFIRGNQPKPTGIHIFEGFMDFLSVLAEKKTKKLADDTIVLNSLSCLTFATSILKTMVIASLIRGWIMTKQDGKRPKHCQNFLKQRSF